MSMPMSPYSGPNWIVLKIRIYLLWLPFFLPSSLNTQPKIHLAGLNEEAGPMGIRTQLRKAAKRGVSPARRGDWLDTGTNREMYKVMGARLLTISEGSHTHSQGEA